MPVFRGVFTKRGPPRTRVPVIFQSLLTSRARRFPIPSFDRVQNKTNPLLTPNTSHRKVPSPPNGIAVRHSVWPFTQSPQNAFGASHGIWGRAQNTWQNTWQKTWQKTWQNTEKFSRFAKHVARNNYRHTHAKTFGDSYKTAFPDLVSCKSHYGHGVRRFSVQGSAA